MTSFWSIGNSAGKRVTNKRIAGSAEIWSVISSLLMH